MQDDNESFNLLTALNNLIDPHIVDYPYERFSFKITPKFVQIS